MKLDNLTLLIPAKEDPPDCLLHVLDELKNYDVEKIIVIPNNATLPEDFKYEKMKVIHQSKNGFGNALIEGIQEINTDFFCIFNADGSFNPSELDGMLKLTKSFDYIFASRYLSNAQSDDDTFITKVGNYIFSKIGSIFFNLKLSDILYTFVICNTKKTKELNLKSKDFGFCVELPIKVKRKNFTYTDIASHERNRHSGKKKVNAFIDGSKILLKMIKLFLNKKI
jgi:cellulose synthase/poly-beta-1,6-N-acetylglucosamine synthase-like glycosyltransferase|tara:strand:- start:131 stop:805 length:675 start_codon:yes stop_codon:yes gene_type:complete